MHTLMNTSNQKLILFGLVLILSAQLATLVLEARPEPLRIMPPPIEWTPMDVAPDGTPLPDKYDYA